MKADYSKVICPNCCNQFTAIPVTAQEELIALRAENAELRKDAERYREARRNPAGYAHLLQLMVRENAKGEALDNMMDRIAASRANAAIDAEKEKMKASYCDECKHFNDEDVPGARVCEKNHKPRWYRQKNDNPYDTGYGYKRVCEDFEEQK